MKKPKVKYIPNPFEPILTTIPGRFYRTCYDKTVGPLEDKVVMKVAPYNSNAMDNVSKYMKYAHENANSALSKSTLESDGPNNQFNYFNDDSDSDDSQGRVPGMYFYPK